MIYNGIDLGQYFKILRIDKNIMPDLDFNFSDLAGKQGLLLKSHKLGARKVKIKFELKDTPQNNLEEQYLMLADLLHQVEPKPLIFKTEPYVCYYAILTNISDIERIGHFAIMEIEFICPKPFKYSIDKTEIKDISGKTIINQGSWETTGQIIVEIKSSVAHLKVTLQNTGEYIYLEDNFKANDIVKINLEDEYVKKNGNLIMDKLYFESDFFDIPIGEFKITLSSGIGTLEFRERWL